MSARSDIILNRICQTAAEQKATEFYFFPVQPPFLRINGEIIPLANEEILTVSLLEEIADSLLSPEEKAKLSAKGGSAEGGKEVKQLIVVKEVGKMGNVQISFVYQKDQLSLCFKLLSHEIEILDKAGLPPVVLNFKHLLQGVVFIVGPRDSGRSSLTASLLDDINKNQGRFIATVEQPIRYRLAASKSVIEQREVGKDVSSFKEGISYIKRRNIDVAMVSLCQETGIVEELLSLAESGVLVFAILNGESSIKFISRFINSFSTERRDSVRSLLADNLGGVIVTRLVPKVGGGERVRALEILPGTLAVKNLINENKINQLNNILELGTGNAIAIDRYLADLVSAGEITFEEGLKYCVDKGKYQILVNR